ncbi:MAG: VOC family protein, partial [Veillonella sp.]|nr:VOC family protein [Veillonella sp.]
KTDCTDNNPPVCFFDTAGTKFELFPLEQLAKDIDENNPPTGNGFAGITLAYNVEHKEDVDNVIELVRNVGGRIVKEPQDVFWGGYHAYFFDPDGYYWEVAWGPKFEFDENGLLKF